MEILFFFLYLSSALTSERQRFAFSKELVIFIAVHSYTSGVFIFHNAVITRNVTVQAMNAFNKSFSTGIPFPLHLFNTVSIASVSGSAIACSWGRESSISLTCGFTMHQVFACLLDFIPLSISFFLALIEDLDGRVQETNFKVITWVLSHRVEVRLGLKSSGGLLVTWLRFEVLDAEQRWVRNNRFC